MGNESSCCAALESNQQYPKGMDPKDLEIFQRPDIPNNSFLITIYDKFYRIVGAPFIQMHISEFIKDVQDLEYRGGVEWVNIKSFDNKIFKTEACSLKTFIQHFKNKTTWYSHIHNKRSVFLKLLFLDNLFIINEDPNISMVSNLENAKIDLINLKIWGLLMSCGKVKEKANIIFDMILGQLPKNRKKSNKDTISWMNPRLIQVIRKLIFFSEIFPKKYMNYFGQKQPQGPGITKTGTHREPQSIWEQTENNNLMSHLDGENQPSSFRTEIREPYLQQVEENFDMIFREIFEERFVDSIFPQFKSTITRENWISAISDDSGMFSGVEFNPFDADSYDVNKISDGTGKCSWLFSTAQIRELFKQQFMQAIGKIELSNSMRNMKVDYPLGSVRGSKSNTGSLKGSINIKY